jgi:CHAT domain-containing protein/Tfp pilus assembly protein PilF
MLSGLRVSVRPRRRGFAWVVVTMPGWNDAKRGYAVFFRSTLARNLRPYVAAVLIALGLAATAVAQQDVTGRLIYVIPPTANVMAGTTVIGAVQTGHRFQIVRTSGEWYCITLREGGKQGWVHRDQVLLEPALSAAQWQEHDKALELHLTGLKAYEQGKPHEALPMLQKALTTRIKLLGSEHPTTADSLNDIGVVHKALGDQVRAGQFYRQALAIYKKTLGVEHPKTASTLNNLGVVYFEKQDYTSAEPMYRQALEIRKKVLGKNHADTAMSLNNLGLLYKELGNPVKAEPLFREALAIDKQVWGLEHRSTVVTLANLAMCYYEMGDYERAEPLYRQALDIHSKLGGQDQPAVAMCLNDLGIVYTNTAAYEKAESALLRALEIRKKLGAETWETANTLNSLGYLYFHMRQYAKAEPLYRQALEIQKKVRGEEHLDTARSLNNLGALYVVTGEYAKAEPFYRQALEIRKKVLGAEHPETASSADNLANLYQGVGEPAKAEPLYEASRRVARRLTAHTLPGLAGREQLLFLSTRDAPQFYRALSFGHAQRENARTAALSAGWVLNGKAVVLEAASEQYRKTAQISDEALAILTKVEKLLAELGVRNLEELAKLNREALPPEQQQRHLRTVEALTLEVGKLQREFEARGFFPEDRYDPWVSTESVRRALPPDGMLIEIARFSGVDFKANAWKPARYVAWLIPPTGDQTVRVVDLGEAEAIDKAIARARTTLASSAESIRKHGEGDAERETLAALRPLAEQVFRPLVSQLGDAKQLILSPDGALWLVPWAALPLADGRYAVEKYQVRYVVSGRDLVTRSEEKKRATGAPLILADPDYDLRPELVAAQTQALLPGGRAGVETLLASLASAQRSVEPARPSHGLSPVPRLPGTAVEAQAIVHSVRTYAGSEPRMFMGTQAVEGVFLAARSPKLVVLSTHGFFFEDQAGKPGGIDRRSGEHHSAKPASPSEAKPLENPLLRCGLMLAGCNQGNPARPANEDGILTGLEIVSTDLRGTELVVLSACETGVGDVRHGEGVAGLRQAFQLAGARSVIATLWPIPDRESALLMSDFFAQLAKGRGKAEALHEAQLARIKARRERNEAAHPFFWAAFTLTGQDSAAR